MTDWFISFPADRALCPCLLWLTTAWSDLWNWRPPATITPPDSSSSSSLSSSTCSRRSSSRCSNINNNNDLWQRNGRVQKRLAKIWLRYFWPAAPKCTGEGHCCSVMKRKSTPGHWSIRCWPHRWTRIRDCTRSPYITINQSLRAVSWR